jgi:hypothetical protein
MLQGEADISRGVTVGSEGRWLGEHDCWIKIGVS